MWLVKPSRCFKGSLPSVFFFYADVVIAPSNVECGEEFLSMQLFQDLFNAGYWVHVTDGPAIDLPVVLRGS